MSEVQVGDLTIAYEILGKGPGVVLTAGGRYAKEAGGVRELGQALADNGFSVLLWDRPNCGHSSVSFEGESESALWADTLAALLRVLDFGPATLAGGSAGSRVSLMTAARHPELVNGLYLWWISGGTYGLFGLGVHYVSDTLFAAARFGMSRVAKLPTWREVIANVPANRDRILAMDRDTVVSTMRSWIDHYIPSAESPVPGMTPADFAGLTVPVTILRSGTSDLHHPRETSEWVHRLIPHSRLIEPPWGDDEWNIRSDAAVKATNGSPFEGWPALAAGITSFLTANSEIAART